MKCKEEEEKKRIEWNVFDPHVPFNSSSVDLFFFYQCCTRIYT